MLAKILYLSYDGLTDPLGQSQIIPYLEGLSKKGHKIHVVSFEKPHAFHHLNQVAKEKLIKANIQWHPQIYHKSPPVFSTLWDLFKMGQAVRKLHKKYNYQIVHCRSYITSLVGLAMKRKYKVKFLFDMRGFWADERVDGGLWDIKKTIYKIIYNYFKKQEIAFLENADAVVSLTNNAQHEINSWSHVNIKAPIHVIPCCVDLSLFNRNGINTSEIQAKRKELEIEKEDFVLTYLGAIGTWYMLDEMLDFFTVLLEQKPNAKFLFISADRDMIIKKAHTKNIAHKNIIIYKAQRDEVPLLLSLAQLSVFFIKPAYSKKASSPTKQGELMAMGVPIICNSGIGDTDEIIKRFNAGEVISDFSPTSYKEVLISLNRIVELNPKSIIEGAYQTYSLDNGIERYSKIYNDLVYQNNNR